MGIMSDLGEGDRSARQSRAYQSLRGLCCGDAFGESFFLPWQQARTAVASRELPEGPWRFTDDTMMAISVVKVLERFGEIEQESLAQSFAELYDPMRGYGPAMHDLLHRIRTRGANHWRVEAQALFAGQGSFGNGSAMRVAPLGAYFADDLDAAMEQAERSAVVTHCHTEAVVGAIAVALAAALASRIATEQLPEVPEFLEQIRCRLPSCEVRKGLDKAMALPRDTSPEKAAFVLGNGTHVSAADTVPFVLWSAARHLDSYEEALWNTVSGLGDRDTTCAMVGGIVVMRTGLEAVPKLWLQRQEPLGAWLSM